MPSKTGECLKCKISIRLTWRGGRRYVLRTVLRTDDFVEPKFLMVLRCGRAPLIKISKKKGWPRSPRPTQKSLLFFQNTIIPGAYDTRCGPSNFFFISIFFSISLGTYKRPMPKRNWKTLRWKFFCGEKYCKKYDQSPTSHLARLKNKHTQEPIKFAPDALQKFV